MTSPAYDIRVTAGGRILVDVRGFPLATQGVTVLFGESGIGKSLLGKSLFGLLDLSELGGSVNGESHERYGARPEVARERRRGFFVSQEPSSHLNPLLGIGEQLSEGRLAQSADPYRAPVELWENGDDFRTLLPLFPRPFRPSGGEKQRLLAGMALTQMDSSAAAGKHGLFVFDEPTGSLDRDARNRFLDRLFSRYRSSPCTILLITHDYSIVGYLRERHGDQLRSIRFLEMKRGGTGVAVREFDPGKYLTWIAGRKAASGTGGGPLLSVESDMRVFGRSFGFFRQGRDRGAENMVVRRGDLVYMKAASGVGKTTVAKVIMGLQAAEHFRMQIADTRLGEVSPRSFWKRALWGKAITMAFQHADEALNLRSTVDESLRSLPAPGVRTPEGRRSLLSRLFSAGSLDAIQRARVAELSGGQKQRLNLLRAFALETPLLILDEPLNALDFESMGKVLDMVEERRSAGGGILLISHNEDIFDAVVSPGRVYHLHET
jgi:ABC-type glutathione transport system ATPase component